MDPQDGLLAPLERVPREGFCRIAEHLKPRDLVHLCLCSKALHGTVANDLEVWRDVLAAAVGDRELVLGARDPRRCARQIVTLDSVRWARIGSGLQRAAGPPIREKYVSFLCHGGNTLLVFGGVIVAPPHPGVVELGFTSECWALDLRTAVWTLAAHSPAVPSPPNAPAPRSFGADGGGGGVLTGADGREWLVVHGGLRAEGFRDNETWILGPLGLAEGAPNWVWREVQADGLSQSPRRPQPRFHHSLTVADNRLVIIGGHDHRITPILAPFVLTLEGLLAEESESSAAGAQNTGRIVGLETVEWQMLHDDDCETPEPRAHHSVVALPSGLLVVFGGEAGTRELSAGSFECEVCHADTWILNPNPEREEPLWSRVPHNFPAVSRKISSSEFGDFPILEADSGPWEENIDHVGRARSALALVEEGRRLVVCGGHAGGDFEYLHDIDMDGNLEYLPTRDDAVLSSSDEDEDRTRYSEETLEENEWVNICFQSRCEYSEALSDVWTLDLTDSEQGWRRVLPDAGADQIAADGYQRFGHVSATAIAMHTSKTLLVLGGHDKGCTDHFGDPRAASSPQPRWMPSPRGQGSLAVEQAWACKMHWSRLPRSSQDTSVEGAASTLGSGVDVVLDSDSDSTPVDLDDCDDVDARRRRRLLEAPTSLLGDSAKVIGRMRALNQHSWCYERCGDAFVPVAAVDSKEGGPQGARLAPPLHQAPVICSWPRLDGRSASVGLVVAVSPSPAGHEIDGMCVQVLDVTTGEDCRHCELARIVS